MTQKGSMNIVEVNPGTRRIITLGKLGGKTGKTLKNFGTARNTVNGT